MLGAKWLLEGPPMPDSEVPDKEKHLGPPVLRFVVGLTSSFRRNTAASKPQQRGGHDPNKCRKATAE